LPSKSLRNAGKTALIVIGAGFGLLRSLKLLGNIAGQAEALENLEARVDTLQLAVARLGARTEQTQTRLDQMVTKEEIKQTLERVLGRVEEEVEARFEHQARSVEALRTMVGQTDELLQRVLDGLESLKVASEELRA
jgi:Na+/phosphate symporter